MSVSDLFKTPLKVVNVGLSSFKDTLDACGADSVHVDWKPPINVDPTTLETAARLKDRIEKANQKALSLILEGSPVLTGLDLAINVIPGMKNNLILHAGPPITWERMCGPMRGAVIGALIYEGKATTSAEAETLAASGKIEYAPCHEHATVGPMAGIVSASMPVFIVYNETHGNKTYTTMNEGLGKVLRYGAFKADVIERLHWMTSVLYPILRDALQELGKIDLKSIISQALHMGDEVHNRNRAATSLLYRALAPAIVSTADDRHNAAAVLKFIDSNDHFFLNLSMAASKCVLDTARNVQDSSVLVVMSRNGVDFGIQLSGMSNTWFTGPAEVPDALYFPGFTINDANPDIGDSSIAETNGLGGFAIAASPAIVQFVGGTVSDAALYTQKMYEITVGENPAFQIPALEFRGSPTGIDVVKVIQKNILPFIDTGVAHKEPGVGQIGAGILNAPVEPFKKAFERFILSLSNETERRTP
ncbi:DUF1116 domain-containing protein [bacterium]|nr:DUF1116 domain-containing protein [bacterium]